jgi:GntR family transcriptional regulator
MAEPMYRQIAADLRGQIEAGRLTPGARLGTELELREWYGASRNTIHDVIDWLITRGLVEIRAGQGIFVTERIATFVTLLTGPTSTGEGRTYATGDADTTQPVAPQASTPRVEILSAAPAVAAALSIETGTPVVTRHEQRYINGRPWSLQTSFYPMSLVDQGATRLIEATQIRQGALAYLREALRIRHAGWRDMITVRPADESETSFFSLPDDGRIPLIEIDRTVCDDHGVPVRHTASVYPADRNRFAISSGDMAVRHTPLPTPAGPQQI